jgi:hypothetical protein
MQARRAFLGFFILLLVVFFSASSLAEVFILHRDGAIWSSATGWTLTTPPYYPYTNYAVDLEIQ